MTVADVQQKLTGERVTDNREFTVYILYLSRYVYQYQIY